MLTSHRRTLANAITLSAMAAMALALPAQAQTSPMEPSQAEPTVANLPEPETAAQPESARTDLQIYSSASRLSAGLQDWRELGVRGTYATGAHVLSAEVSTTRRFGETGVYVGMGDSYTFNPDWFGSLSIGAGDNTSYLPQARVDGFINVKLLPERNLIATLGTGYYSAPDGHNDRNVSVGATHYFTAQPLILQGEVRINFSRPGNVKTRQQFLALTWGRAKATQVTTRYAWGREGYQAIGNGDSRVNFSSHQSSLTLRHWLGPDWGLAAGLDRYHNPFYNRTGITLGMFWEQP